MEDKPNYWFKRRRYGYGWFPSSKQGWWTIAVYVIFIIGSSIILLKDTPEDEFTAETAIYFGIFGVATGLLIAVANSKGPRPKWRWGKKPDVNPKENW